MRRVMRLRISAGHHLTRHVPSVNRRAISDLRRRHAAAAAALAALVALSAPVALAATPLYSDWPALGRLIGGDPKDVVVSDAGYAYCATGVALTVIDVSDPNNLQQVGYAGSDEALQCVALSGQYAYAAKGSTGVAVFDVSDPAHPAYTGGTYTVGTTTVGLAVSSSRLYLATWDQGIYIVDHAPPTGLIWRGHCDTPGHAAAVAVSGSYAYVADREGGLRIINVSDPMLPAEVGHLVTDSPANSIALDKGYAYVGTDAGLEVIDVYNPAAPVQASKVSLPGRALDVVFYEGIAYVADDAGGLRLVDVSDPKGPFVIGSGATTGHASGVYWLKDRAYVADGVGGLRVFDVGAPASPTEIGYLDVPASADDIAVANGYACVADLYGGLSVVNVSDPAAPTVTGVCRNVFGGAVAVSGSFAYVAAGTDGLQIVDLWNPALPVKIGACDTPGNALDVAVAGSYAYVADGPGGLRIINVADPVHPTEVGALAIGDEAAAVAVAGGYAYVAALTGGLRIINVSSPAHPVEVGSYYPAVDCLATEVAVQGHYAFVTIDKPYSADMAVVDVSDPTNPTEVGTSGSVAWGYDVAVSGEYAYVADWWSGLKIFDIASPDSTLYVAQAKPGLAGAVAISNGLAYVAEQGWGIYIYPAAPGTLSGQVRDAASSTPLPGVTVTAYLGGMPTGTATAGVGGIYQIRNLIAGNYSVVADASGYVHQTRAPIAVSFGGTSYANFNLTASGCLTGQVRERGATLNLEYALVTLYQSGRQKAQLMTNGNGIYRMDTDLPAGTYTATASCGGYLDQTKAGILVVSGQITYVNFNLEHVPAMKGQVRAAGSGAKLGGATVRVYAGDVLKATVTADGNGIYAVPGGASMPPDTYTVRASKAGYVRQGKANAAVSTWTTYVNFSLPVSCKLMGQVKGKVSGQPIVGATIEVRSGGVLWATGTSLSPYGIYAIDTDLPTGTHVVAASKPGYIAQIKKDIVLSTSAVTYVNFSLP